MILHVRPIGLLTGIGVARSVGSWVALRPKVFFYNWLLGTPLGGSAPGPRMRAVYTIFQIEWLQKVAKKRNYRENPCEKVVNFAPWGARNVKQSLIFWFEGVSPC